MKSRSLNWITSFQPSESANKESFALATALLMMFAPIFAHTILFWTAGTVWKSCVKPTSSRHNLVHHYRLRRGVCSLGEVSAAHSERAELAWNSTKHL